MQSAMPRIDCRPISFALWYRERDGGAPHSQNEGGRGGNYAHHGVSIRVIGQVGETETEPLRFDSFENNPLYHYAPARENARIMLDKTITENPLGWTIAQLRIKLPAILQRAGYDTLAGYPTIAAQLDHDVLASALRELEAKIPPIMPAAHG